MPQLIAAPEMRTLHGLLTPCFEYKVPSFQRGYTWGPKEWRDLWDDICALEEGAQQAKGKQQHGQHYMGHLVLQQQAPREFVIVDGQQRIATLCLLAFAAAECIENEIIGNQIVNRYLYMIDIPTLARRKKLIMNRLNDPFYQKLILERNFKRSANEEHLSNQKVHRAFMYFRKRIREKFGRNDEEIFEFFDHRVGDGLIFTILKVEGNESALAIRESLNTRGVKSSAHESVPELLKNYLFSIIQDSGESEHYMNLWHEVSEMLRSENFPNFLKHYWNSKYDTPATKNNLYRIARKQLRTINDVLPLLNDMKDAANVYMMVRRMDTTGWTQEAREILDIYQGEIYYPLLFAVHKKLGPTNEFNEAARICAIIVFRWRMIGNRNPYELGSEFHKATQIFRKIAQSTSELSRILHPVYLRDGEFQVAFSQFNIASHNHENATRKKRKLARHILSALEKGGKTLVDSKMVCASTLEHILPQNPKKDWDEFDSRDAGEFLWRLGNLTLLESEKNREAANRPFTEKCLIYESSDFKLTRD